MGKNLKSDGRRMFLAAFLLTLGVLALIMVVTVVAVQPAMPENPTDTAPPESYRPPAVDSMTTIVIAEQTGGANDFLLIRFNPQYGQLPLTLLPSSSLVTLDGGRVTLGEVYQKGGGRAVKSALSDRLGILVDRYLVINAESFIRIATKIGTVVFTLPADYSYTRDGFAVNLPAGERRLDGQDIVNLFRSPLLERDLPTKSKLLGDLAAAAINQNLSAASDKLSSGIFKLAINLVKSDISYADYESRRQSADFLSTLETQVAGNLPIQGISLETGGGFELSEDYVRLIQQYFERTP